MTISAVEVVQKDSDTVVARFVGDHDLTTRDETHTLLQTLVADNTVVVVDLSDATFIDSSLLHNLMEADSTARARGMSVRLQLGGNAGVRRVLELIGLLDHFEVLASTGTTQLHPSLAQTVNR